MPTTKAGDNLTILVEAMGRINFGRAIKDFKGITDNVTINIQADGHELTYNLKDWTIDLLPDDVDVIQSELNRPHNDLDTLLDVKNGAKRTGVFQGTFSLRRVGDTFVNMENFNLLTDYTWEWFSTFACD